MIVQHWSMKSTIMGETVYTDSYAEDEPGGPAYKIVKSTMIGLAKDGGTYIFSFFSWDFQTPPFSVYKLPALCMTEENKRE